MNFWHYYSLEPFPCSPAVALPLRNSKRHSNLRTAIESTPSPMSLIHKTVANHPLNNSRIETRFWANCFVVERTIDCDGRRMLKGPYTRIHTSSTNCKIRKNVKSGYPEGRIFNFNIVSLPFAVTSRTKTFASLFRTRFGVRSRLQVNSIELKDEKIGANKTYFNRLATEWDEYYIHELRHRPPVKKFRVKT